jgi:hypothetical protein
MTRGWGKRTAEEAGRVAAGLALLPPADLSTIVGVRGFASSFCSVTNDAVFVDSSCWFLLVFSLPERARALPPSRGFGVSHPSFHDGTNHEPHHVYRLLLLLFAKPFSAVVLICSFRVPVLSSDERRHAYRSIPPVLLLFFGFRTPWVADGRCGREEMGSL